MSTANENTESKLPVESQPVKWTFSDSTVNDKSPADGRKYNFGNIMLALTGAAIVAGAYHLLTSAAAVFTAILPYVAGSMLFATLLGGFYYLLAAFKTMRKNARLRISFWDAYTAVSVFTVMGYFATACMHAFQGTGQALVHWNRGSAAVAVFTIFFGIAKFVGELWNSDEKKTR